MQARVYKIHSDFYYVKNYKAEEFVCKLRDVLKKQKIDIRVGDFVELSADNSFIASLCKRKNFIDRPKVSNIDYVVIVCALKEPELDFIQLNRYLTYFKYHNIDCILCFNKEDLIDDLKNIKDRILNIYQKLSYPIFFISAKYKSDLDEFLNFIKGKTVALCGMSGVGKTTLLNSINPDVFLKTGDISSKTLRGTHTTRHIEIIQFDDYKIMDTPGFSCLKFDFLLPEKLIDLFDDLKQYKDKCKYSNCLHNTDESGICAIKDNLSKIEKTRYESYLEFLKEAVEYKEFISKRSIKKESFNKNTGNRKSVKISKRKRNASRNTQKQKIKDEE